MTEPTPRRHDQAALALFVVIPLLVLRGTLGPYRAPGHPTEMLYGSVLSGSQLRAWLMDGGWGTATGALAPPPFWPENLVIAAVEAILGSMGAGLGVGLATLLAFIAAGIGPYALGRRLGADAWAAGAVAVALQLSPPVLRAVGSGEPGALALGWICLAGWAALGPSPRSTVLAGLFALLSGGWGALGGLVVAGVGVATRRWVLLLGLMGVLGLAAPPSPLTGSARLSPPVVRTVPAYVGATSGVLPLPPSEQPESTHAPPPPPAGPPGAGSPPPPASTGLERLPGGLGLWLVLGAGLVAARRSVSALGLIGVAGWVLAFGWLPAAGTPPPVPPAWLEALGPGLPATRAPVGLAAWLLLPLTAAAWVHRGDRPLPRPVWGAVVAAAGLAALIENPRLRVPVTNLAPSAVTAAIAGLDHDEGSAPGAVVVFPSPTHPWRQGRGSAPALLVDALAQAHPVRVGTVPGGEASLLAALSERAGLPVDLDALDAVWAHRDRDPIDAAREAGFVGLVVDRSTLDPEAAQRVDGWLAARVGTAVVEDGARAAYRLTPLAGAGGVLAAPPPLEPPTPPPSAPAAPPPGEAPGGPSTPR